MASLEAVRPITLSEIAEARRSIADTIVRTLSTWVHRLTVISMAGSLTRNEGR